MEFDEARELAFLNAMTLRNRASSTPPRRRRRERACLWPCAIIWLIGTIVLILLAHLSAIPGWLMHLGTEILTFRFALRLGKERKYERRYHHV